MHAVLTLQEVLLRIVSEGGSADAQASQERTGGYTVTVIRRGQGCATYTWDAGGGERLKPLLHRGRERLKPPLHWAASG